MNNIEKFFENVIDSKTIIRCYWSEWNKDDDEDTIDGTARFIQIISVYAMPDNDFLVEFINDFDDEEDSNVRSFDTWSNLTTRHGFDIMADDQVR